MNANLQRSYPPSLITLLPPEPPQRVGVERHGRVGISKWATARRDLEHLDVFAHRADGEVVFEVAGAHHLQLVGQADVALAPARAERDYGRRWAGLAGGRRGGWRKRGIVRRCRAAIANEHLGVQFRLRDFVIPWIISPLHKWLVVYIGAIP